MKKIIILLVVLGTSAEAHELRCWKTNFKNVKTPYLIANIVNDRTLTNVRFLYKNSPFESADVKIIGKLNTNNRSPYKGTMDYIVKDNFTITLPVDLSNDNLIKIEPKGIGYYKNENGVIVSLDDADRACDSYCTSATERLSCRSTL